MCINIIYTHAPCPQNERYYYGTIRMELFIVRAMLKVALKA